MNEDLRTEFDRKLDRALKTLPELQAPRTLMPRVMAAVAARTSARWYTLPWHAWPAWLQALSMTVLLAGFGAFSYAAWQLGHAAGQTETMAELRNVFSGGLVLWRTLGILVESVLAVVRQLGPYTLAFLGMVLLMAYAGCIGVGTLFYRLAWVRTERL